MKLYKLIQNGTTLRIRVKTGLGKAASDKGKLSAGHAMPHLVSLLDNQFFNMKKCYRTVYRKTIEVVIMLDGQIPLIQTHP